MQQFIEPLFQKGRVLKKESLDALKAFPQGVVSLGLSDWSPGVLYGFDLAYENGQVEISAGAVWYQEQLIQVKKETLPFRAYEQQVTACLRLYPSFCTEDFLIRQMELRLKNGEPGKDEIELGRFRLSKGARLRKDYRDLRDCRTAYNTLDVTQIPYAGPGGATVSPLLLRTFARMVLMNKNAGETDVQFAFLCLNSRIVSRECLLYYLCRRLCEPLRELSHSEIYERLLRIAGPGGRGIKEGHRNDGPAIY